MRIRRTPAVVALLCGLALPISFPWQADGQTATPSTIRQGVQRKHGQKTDHTLTPDDGLAVISAALDSKMRILPERDCSHLVHAIYERAGFHYAYVSSSDLYFGVEGFQRVWHPQPGDLIVWRGHVGIVVRPSRHVFYSLLRSGPGTDDYENPYWSGRGVPRFYRYVKNDPCAGCTSISTTFPRIREEE
jgi:cell wall-associated NlpC family hydrolase